MPGSAASGGLSLASPRFSHNPLPPLQKFWTRRAALCRRTGPSICVAVSRIKPRRRRLMLRKRLRAADASRAEMEDLSCWKALVSNIVSGRDPIYSGRMNHSRSNTDAFTVRHPRKVQVGNFQRWLDDKAGHFAVLCGLFFFFSSFAQFRIPITDLQTCGKFVPVVTVTYCKTWKRAACHKGHILPDYAFDGGGGLAGDRYRGSDDMDFDFCSFKSEWQRDKSRDLPHTSQNTDPLQLISAATSQESVERVKLVFPTTPIFAFKVTLPVDIRIEMLVEEQIDKFLFVLLVNAQQTRKNWPRPRPFRSEKASRKLTNVVTHAVGYPVDRLISQVESIMTNWPRAPEPRQPRRRPAHIHENARREEDQTLGTRKLRSFHFYEADSRPAVKTSQGVTMPFGIVQRSTCLELTAVNCAFGSVQWEGSSSSVNR
ncbi:hypothetical protein F2P81_001389 [Scophthalmus maximus]|uniref:Uncharacterized protein n=1 Tax=Scophthalmus maximus TaxID=52904 RepID=A0A6A4TMJ5_SCOMX|nr:hypothetical protein F2P81_001389 [Scophthalmus maximus]